MPMFYERHRCLLLQCKQFDAVVARVANFSVAEGDVGSGVLGGARCQKGFGVLAQGYQDFHCTVANGFIAEGPLQELRGPPMSLAHLLLQ
jgi:hypothetical protein